MQINTVNVAKWIKSMMFFCKCMVFEARFPCLFLNLLFKNNSYTEVETEQVPALKHPINCSFWECAFFVQEKEVWVPSGQLLTLPCLVQASFNQYEHLQLQSLTATGHCVVPPCLSLRTAVSSTASAQLRVKEFCAFKESDKHCFGKRTRKSCQPTTSLKFASSPKVTTWVRSEIRWASIMRQLCHHTETARPNAEGSFSVSIFC